MKEPNLSVSWLPSLCIRKQERLTTTTQRINPSCKMPAWHVWRFAGCVCYSRLISAWRYRWRKHGVMLWRSDRRVWLAHRGREGEREREQIRWEKGIDREIQGQETTARVKVKESGLMKSSGENMKDKTGQVKKRKKRVKRTTGLQSVQQRTWTLHICITQ